MQDYKNSGCMRCGYNARAQIQLCDSGQVTKAGQTAANSDVARLAGIYETAIAGYTKAFEVIPGLPPPFRKDLWKDLEFFRHTMANNLALASTGTLASQETKPQRAEQFSQVIQKETNRLNHILERREKHYAAYLSICAGKGYHSFLFISERSEATCDQCHEYHGALLTEEEVMHQQLIPPLHPNCKCQMIAVDSLATQVYQNDKTNFLFMLERTLDDMDAPGGLYLLEPSFFIDGVSADTLYRVDATKHQQSILNHNSFDWKKELWHWVSGHHTMELIDSLYQAGERFWNSVDEATQDVPLVNLLFLAGIYGFRWSKENWDGLYRRHEQWVEAPSFYTWANSALLGAVEEMGQLFFSDNPESFEHMVNGLGTVFVTYLLTDGFGGVFGELLEGFSTAAEEATHAGVRTAERLADAVAPAVTAVVESAQRYGRLLADIFSDWVDIFIRDDTIRGELLELIDATPENPLIPRDLLDELVASGEKYTLADIVAITKTPDGQLVWLETGHLGEQAAGLVHILDRHACDFAHIGIAVEEIPVFVMESISTGTIIGYQGAGTSRPIFEFVYQGQRYQIAVTIGSNGFVVGANPKSSP